MGGGGDSLRGTAQRLGGWFCRHRCFLKARLRSVKTPTLVVIVDELPRTSVGKIAKKDPITILARQGDASDQMAILVQGGPKRRFEIEMSWDSSRPGRKSRGCRAILKRARYAPTEVLQVAFLTDPQVIADFRQCRTDFPRDRDFQRFLQLAAYIPGDIRRFSFVFSSSSDRSRLASEISIPPNLAFHL